MKIARLGLFRNTWVCYCGNMPKKAGFFPVNPKGDFDWHPLQRSAFYACVRCGRIIERQSGEIVGVTPNFKLTAKEVWLLLVCLQEEGRRPVGLGIHILLEYLAPSLRRTLGPRADYGFAAQDDSYQVLDEIAMEGRSKGGEE